NSVALAQLHIQPAIGNFPGRLIKNFRLPNVVNGEAPQTFSQVAPGVEIPAFPIAYETLWRNRSLKRCVAGTRVITHSEPVTRKQGLRNHPEKLGRRRTPAEMKDPDPMVNLGKRMIRTFHQRLQSFLQRLDMTMQQPGMQLF